MKVPPFLRRSLAPVLSFDLRTLALLRAALGSALLASLLARFCDLAAFHADGGVLPRALLVAGGSPAWSLHLADGSALYAGTLLAVQALAAFCLAVGYRTRLAAALSWLLLLSLHNRNPLVLTPGDDPLLWLLFWGMFLPLGARWSVDAAWAAAPRAAPHARSWASAGLVLQVVSCGVSGATAHPLLLAGALLALSPFGGAWWDWLARRRDHGRHLKVYYDEGCAFCLKSCLLLRALLILPRTELLPAQGSARAQALMQAQYTWVVIDGEDVAHTRWDAVVALVRHSLLLGWAWRLAALKLWQLPGNAAYDWVARHRGRLGRITRAQFAMREVRFDPPAWTQALPALVLVASLAWVWHAVAPLPAPAVPPLANGLATIRMDVAWDEYLDDSDSGPTPARWLIAPGQLADGTAVDALRPWQQGVDFGRPRRPERNARWQWYHARLAAPDRPRNDELSAYARYLCRRWNGAPPLARFKLVYMLEEATVEQVVLWQHDCATGAAP